MNGFTNENVRKEYKKKTILLIISIILFILTFIIGYYREKAVDKKLKESTDLHSVILMSDNISKSAELTINNYMGFANYKESKDKAYYMVGDKKYLYVIYANVKDMQKLTEEDLEKGVKLSGTTELVKSDVKKLAIDAYNEEFKDDENFNRLYIQDYDYYFGNIYLDTTKTKYALTTEYNALIIFVGFIGLIIFIPALIGIISYKKKTKKLSIEEFSNLDAQMNDPSSIYYQKSHLYLTKDYIIDLKKFNYFNYKDIKWIYKNVYSVNGVPSNQSLVVTKKDGKIYYVGTTNCSKKMNEVFTEMFDVIMSKNPDIRIGYTKENMKINNEENKEMKRIKKEEKKKNKE